MKNECHIVRDLLPLYLEEMVSEETADYIQEHLSNCSPCAEELEALRSGQGVPQPEKQTEQPTEDAVVRAIKSLRRKFRKKVFCATGIIAAVLIVCSVLLHFFPVWRLLHIGPMAMGSYYTNEQIGMALYIGSSSDRTEAQAVLRLADKAFNDVRHTREENEKEYGLLSRYATATDNYGDVAFNEHSLELWSAHLDENEGWIWVFYSDETFHHDGSTACGSWRIPSLWKVEKNDSGEWVVVQIREHP